MDSSCSVLKPFRDRLPAFRFLFPDSHRAIPTYTSAQD
jgi:hypothetical protein